eukprot:292574-Hanusia_phi.AAC.8
MVGIVGQCGMWAMRHNTDLGRKGDEGFVGMGADQSREEGGDGKEEESGGGRDVFGQLVSSPLLQGGPLQLFNPNKSAAAISQDCFKGDLNAVQRRFEGNVHEVDADENTPVHWAALKGHDGVLEYLIQKGFPLASKNKDGDAPMYTFQCHCKHWAASGGNEKVIQILMNYNADPWVVNKDGTTPLHLAAADGNHDAVRILAKSAGPVLNTAIKIGKKKRMPKVTRSMDCSIIPFALTSFQQLFPDQDQFTEQGQERQGGEERIGCG